MNKSHEPDCGFDSGLTLFYITIFAEFFCFMAVASYYQSLLFQIIPLQTQRFIPVESDTISPNICGFGIGLILETSVSPETCLFFEALSFASVSEDIFFKDCRWIGATRSTIGSFFLYSRFKSIFSMFYRMVVLLERKLIFTENVCTFCM